MSGLFGYLDPRNDLPSETAERMARVMGCPADRSTSILRGPSVTIGCVSKGIYHGEGEPLAGVDPNRTCLFMGRILGVNGQQEGIDPVAAARTAFLDDASPGCLSSTNGPFAAAVSDETDGHLELITDRYGMYPIYVAKYRSAVLFSTQIKGLLAAGVLPLELNPLAITLMLTIGELVGEHTPFRAIRLLPAGSKVVFSTGTESVTRYWQYQFDAQDMDFEDTARQLGRQLRIAVKQICSDSVSVGVPLSGGLDSRVLLAATPDPTKVPSFTWGIAGCRDMRYAAEAAQILGSPHQTFEYEGDHLERSAAPGVWITEGQLPAIDFHVFPFVDRMAARCDIILNGYAGDAVLGGNFIKRAWWHAPDRTQAAAALWRWRDTMVQEPYRTGLLGDMLEECDWSTARAAFIDAYHEAPGHSTMDATMAFLLDNRVRRYTSCGTSLLRWRVESDHPFFDNDFFDCASRVPYAWRSRHRFYLQVMRTCFADIAKVRWQRTGLPAACPQWLVYSSLAAHRLGRIKPLKPLFRSRQATNFPDWLRGPLRTYVTNLLCDHRTLDRGLFGADALRRVVQDHMEGRVDNTSLIGSLMTLELFARLFVDADAELINRCRVDAPSPQAVSAEPVR